jgi:hypothetical protein
MLKIDNQLWTLSDKYPLPSTANTGRKSKCKNELIKVWESGDFPPGETERICSQAHAHFWCPFVARELCHQIWVEVSNQLIWKCKTVEHKNKYKTWTTKTYL